jgi:hypothetical protein
VTSSGTLLLCKQNPPYEYPLGSIHYSAALNNPNVVTCITEDLSVASLMIGMCIYTNTKSFNMKSKKKYMYTSIYLLARHKTLNLFLYRKLCLEGDIL